MYEKTRNEEATSDLLTRLYGTNNVQEFIDEYKAETRLKTKTMTLWEVDLLSVTYLNQDL